MKFTIHLLTAILCSCYIHSQNVELVVLGTTQDAGSPQIACKKKCCLNLNQEEKFNRMVVSLGLVDFDNRSTYLFEASPDIFEQNNLLSTYSNSDKDFPDAIFLTHGHIGHYTGLMYLGRESMNSNKIPIYCMPRMKNFLISNQPWKQLIELENISLMELKEETPIPLAKSIRVTPLLVPHRDELTETVGYIIKGPNKSALFIPDIDKWEKWGTNISELIHEVDFAFLDATFYDGEEIKARDLSEIPHPFVIESMNLFYQMANEDKAKVHFIHFNHTNALLNKNSTEYKTVISEGFKVAEKGMRFKL